MSNEPESALDLILDPNREVPEDVESAVAVFMAAHRELAALRQRCEDAELIVRAFADRHPQIRTRIQPCMDGHQWTIRDWKKSGYEQDLIRVWADDRGLPILTPEARSALKEE